MAEPRLSTVGTEKTADHDVAHVPVKPLKDIIVDVDWQVETKPEWKSTTESEANKTFITKYKLYKTDAGEDYKYKLEYVTIYTREYDFIDADDRIHRGESKGGETTKISYNSDKPAIKVIKL